MYDADLLALFRCTESGNNSEIVMCKSQKLIK